MRNLALIASDYTTFSYANTNWSAAALDLDEGILYAASETQNLNGEIDVELWKVGSKRPLTNDQVQVCSPFDKWEWFELIASVV